MTEQLSLSIVWVLNYILEMNKKKKILDLGTLF